MRVDAHQHFWRYTDAEFGWIDDDSAAIRRDWMPEDLKPLLAASRVEGTVAVQARQTEEETLWLLDLADAHPWILGVVGWADLRDEHFAEGLAALLSHKKLCGLRHVVQGEPAGFLDTPEFNRGVSALAGTRLVYDLLIFPRQIEEATRFVDRHPRQAFVLDHVAKPDIEHGEIAFWSRSLRELAQRANVSCKLSGMVTEAGFGWTREKLQPYFDTVLEAFGTDRLMAASDWPVLMVQCAYAEWWNVLGEALASLTEHERGNVEGVVAQRIYGLDAARM